MTKARIKASIPIAGSDDRIVLLNWSADDTPRLRNVVRIDAAGRVIWSADLPGSASHDCFVSLRRDGERVVARTYTGLETCLNDGGGVEMSRTA